MARVEGSNVTYTVIRSRVWSGGVTSSYETVRTELSSFPGNCLLHFIVYCHGRDTSMHRNIVHHFLLKLDPFTPQEHCFGFVLVWPHQTKSDVGESFEKVCS